MVSVNHSSPRTPKDGIFDPFAPSYSKYVDEMRITVARRLNFDISVGTVECDSDGSKTPPSAPCLNGVSDTCPGAPIKLTGRSRVIDLGFCRKLEF
ncbi:hypothetical protein J1N35_042508 [Gossypium stocksii]|uniref:Uncharacterized protein n=1 Tax=Gossypium stocksii TaxID=47602 RepID=A0A9D3ZE08_9ROSI|nr:hypothetical protein J1N35_042508 [Gossypium stocksii]